MNKATFKIPVLITSGHNRLAQNSLNKQNPVLLVHRSNGTVVQDQKCTDLDFCLLNAQSLNNKAGELTDFNVVALTETWFSQMESASRTLCTPSGYKLLDYPRTSRTGGGTVVLFRTELRSIEDSK